MTGELACVEAGKSAADWGVETDSQMGFRCFLSGPVAMVTWPLLLPRLVRFWSIEDRAPQAVASLPNGLCCAFSTTGSVLAAG